VCIVNLVTMAGPPSNLGVKPGWGGCKLSTEHNLTTISSSPNIVTFAPGPRSSPRLSSPGHH
ncbi:hypothetical protein H9Q73_014430, partial [Fusarium xylarioides]